MLNEKVSAPWKLGRRDLQIPVPDHPIAVRIEARISVAVTEMWNFILFFFFFLERKGGRGGVGDKCVWVFGEGREREKVLVGLLRAGTGRKP